VIWTADRTAQSIRPSVTQPKGTMTGRHFALLLLVSALLARAPHAHAAHVLDAYDVDSLSAMATLIVKVKLGDAAAVHTRDGD
jgi:hypothetical protein